MTTVRKTHIKKEVKYTPKKITIKYRNTTGDAILKIVERDDPMTPEQQAHFDAMTDSIINDAEEQSMNDERQDEMFTDDPDDSGVLEGGSTIEEPEEEIAASDEVPDDQKPEGEPPPDEPTSEEPEPDPEEKPKAKKKAKKKAAKKKAAPTPDPEPEPEPATPPPPPTGTGLVPPTPPPAAPAPVEETAVNYQSMDLPVFEESDMPNFSKMTKGHLEWYVNQAEKQDLLLDIKWNFGVSLNSTYGQDKIRNMALKIIFDQLKIK